MISKESFKRYLRQIFAIVEKNFFLEFKVRSEFIIRFLNPIIQLLVLLFIFQTIFNINPNFQMGYWDSNNYILFLLIGFIIQFSHSVTNIYDKIFTNEKYWKTLSATMVAPVHKFTLLIGILISELIINSIPLIILFLIALILFPISLIYIFLFLIVIICCFVILASIGLIISVFRISNEELVPYSFIALRFIFLFSCTNYPKQIFPEFIQFFILINPLYYIFDLLRLIWYLGINYELAMNNITIIHILTTIILTILGPIISIYLFNKIYKKYGITGY